MENAISDFNCLLKALQQETHGHTLIESLELISSGLAEGVGIRLYFTHVRGLRWSYLAGYRAEEADDRLNREYLGWNIGCVLLAWGETSTSERAGLLSFLRNLVAVKAGPDNEH